MHRYFPAASSPLPCNGPGPLGVTRLGLTFYLGVQLASE
jgi:hypothetical protein